MSRRKTGFPFLGLLFVLLLVGYFFFQLQQRPVPRQHRSRERRYSEHAGRPGRRENSDRSREQAAPAQDCSIFGITCESQYLAQWRQPRPGSCSTRLSHGYPVPDPRCTPGGIDASVSEETIRNPAWRTRCLRNCQSSEAEKHVTYKWYGIVKPRENSGESQVCELDHLVPLELGGADGLGNIWPECGPAGVSLDGRYFKLKDRVENYLADEVKAGRMPLAEAQQGIAADWTRYLPEANRYCAAGGRC
ncbi:MAG: hypothetical protein HIU93_02680 [Acidobacteria bacterium]|nr:hypothetical protein [Acidobacteriota bacterium]